MVQLVLPTLIQWRPGCCPSALSAGLKSLFPNGTMNGTSCSYFFHTEQAGPQMTSLTLTDPAGSLEWSCPRGSFCALPSLPSGHQDPGLLKFTFWKILVSGKMLTQMPMGLHGHSHHMGSCSNVLPGSCLWRGLPHHPTTLSAGPDVTQLVHHVPLFHRGSCESSGCCLPRP